MRRQDIWLVPAELAILGALFVADVYHHSFFSKTPYLFLLGWTSLRWRGIRWKDVGFTKPRSWGVALLIGILSGLFEAMRDAAGNISMWIGSNTDIHEEKQTEEELRRANEDLNLFAFAASHDLQEPLRMITSYSQLLVKEHRGAFDDDAEVLVGYIGDGTRRMRELLSDLLAYTAVGEEQEEASDLIDLNAVVRKVLENLKTSIREAGASISVDPLPCVRGAEVHFVQLFQNLIGNAIKYRGQRPATIHVSAQQINGEWRFEVSDKGIGIAPEYHEKVFAVFKRLHGKKIPGTGVGLAICKRVVERHGGRIWVESQAGQGAKFRFTLPVAGESR
jgi:light-regulated signal transduction histidine kinase (bacteriophytochrome)